MENFPQIRVLFWLGSATMAFLAIGVIFLGQFYQNRLFKLKKREAYLRMRAVLNKEQEERTRISSDLHDTLSGNLSSIHIYFNLLRYRIKDPEILEMINEVGKELKDTQQVIRDITYNLMPQILTTDGFIPSVEDYLRKSGVRNGFTYEVKNEGFPELSQQSSYQILQILLEFITNSCRHGEAKHIKITFSSVTGINEVIFKDDGKKYDFFNELEQSFGYGLKNILSRVEYLDGHLRQCDSVMGNHFVISIKDEE